MTTASAPGKVILFGEHFVVYGLPAIATAIGARTSAEVQRAAEFSLVDNRPETPGYKVEKRNQQLDSVQRILRKVGIGDTRVRIVLGGDLVAASGVGASAASCSAIAAALNEEFELGLDIDEINALAFEGERAYHGTPSGIDNSCSTYGGFIWFRRNLTTEESVINPLDADMRISIAVGNTGITSNTTEVVEEVRMNIAKEPERYEQIFDGYLKIAEAARAALERRDLNALGQLMNRNQDLLREIGVSSPDLETLLDIALKNGALGAKLTGTGRGGLMIALVTDETRDVITSEIEAAGYMSNSTSIGAEGVKVTR